MGTVSGNGRRTPSGQPRRSQSGRTATTQSRQRAAARRRRLRRRRQILISSMVILVLLLIAGIGLGVSGRKKQKVKEALQTEGIAYLDQGNYDAAIKSFDEILVLNKGKIGSLEISVLQYRAEAEYKQGDYQAALQTSETLIKADGEKESYLKLRGRCQLALGDYENALQYQPLAALAYNYMAAKAINEGRYEEALDLIEKGMAEGDSDVAADLAFNQAAAYDKMGNFEKALELFETYVQTYGPDENAEREITFLKSRQE